MKKNLILIIFVVFILTIFLYIFNNIGKNNIYITKVASYIPFEIKEKIRNTIFVFRKVQLLEEKIELQKIMTQNTEEQFEDFIFAMHDEAEKLGYIPLRKSLDKKEIIINKNIFQLEKYKTFMINTSKYPKSKSNSYIDVYKDQLILSSAHGIFAHVIIEELNQDNPKLKIIKSNLKDIINYKEFFLHSAYGIKDIMVSNNKLYISYVNKKIIESKACYNTSILAADIDLEELKFQVFFDPEECVNGENLGAHNSGGRMIDFDNNILLTVGEYNFMKKSQDKKSIFGKIVMINKKTKFVKTIAMGLRNSQGLYYSRDKNLLFFTDHGPQGGDEVNYLKYDSSDNNFIENYGWPEASYGEHYGGKDATFNEKLYKIAPLKKSHSDFNFKEPLKYFDPSIGISQLIQADNNFIKTDNSINLIVSSLGQNPEEGDMSLHLISLEDNLNILESKKIIINERIRDMLYYKDDNKVILFLETSGSIGILKKIN